MSSIGTGNPFNRRRGARALLVVSVVVLLDSPAWGQSAQRPFSQGSRTGALATVPSGAAAQHARKIGVPQVIEIPLPEPTPLPSPPWQESVEAQNSQSEPLAGPPRTIPFTRPGYLGLLYATAEDGPGGVRVLAVIAGSPAEQAGFSASPRLSPKTDLVLTVTAVLMVLTPAAPLAIALGLARDAYDSQLAERGDLITAVAGQPVRDALEFNDVMRHFGPGDTVAFMVQRGGTQVRLAAQLAAEP
jgi:hypothetical protein